jgi:hypothetical protein
MAGPGTGGIRIGVMGTGIVRTRRASLATPPRCRRRRCAGIVAAGALLLAACAAHGGGDPGNRVLHALEPVVQAVPPMSTSVASRRYTASWQSACPDNAAAHSGWSEVQVTASFTNSLPRRVVEADIGAALARLGWTRQDVSLGRGQGPIAHWWRRVGPGRLADVTAFPVPSGSAHWTLSAMWAPPGFALPGC